MPWISIRNWRKFQHYDPEKRVPPWIKNNTELMSDDSYLGLTGHDRAVLHGLWLEYASARCRLRLDTRSLSRRLSLRVTMTTIERLVDAGFMDIVASATLADGYHSASPRARAEETETETETKEPPSLHPVPNNEEGTDGTQNGRYTDHDIPHDILERAS